MPRAADDRQVPSGVRDQTLARVVPPVTPADIRKADAEARRRFSYKHDPADFDNYRSHADAVIAGQRWQGDCDDLASTVIDLLERRGAARDRLMLCKVDSTGDGRIDHMIAIAIDADGQEWVVGDTFAPVYVRARCRHRIIEISKVSDGLTWAHVG